MSFVYLDAPIVTSSTIKVIIDEKKEKKFERVVHNNMTNQDIKPTNETVNEEHDNDNDDDVDDDNNADNIEEENLNDDAPIENDDEERPTVRLAIETIQSGLIRMNSYSVLSDRDVYLN
jgi:hypothetical protein